MAVQAHFTQSSLKVSHPGGKLIECMKKKTTQEIALLTQKEQLSHSVNALGTPAAVMGWGGLETDFCKPGKQKSA